MSHPERSISRRMSLRRLDQARASSGQREKRPSWARPSARVFQERTRSKGGGCLPSLLSRSSVLSPSSSSTLRRSRWRGRRRSGSRASSSSTSMASKIAGSLRLAPSSGDDPSAHSRSPVCPILCRESTVRLAGWKTAGRWGKRRRKEGHRPRPFDRVACQTPSLPSALRLPLLPLPLADQPPGPNTTTLVSESTCSKIRSEHSSERVFGVFWGLFSMLTSVFVLSSLPFTPTSALNPHPLRSAAALSAPETRGSSAASAADQVSAPLLAAAADNATAIALPTFVVAITPFLLNNALRCASPSASTDSDRALQSPPAAPTAAASAIEESNRNRSVSCSPSFSSSLGLAPFSAPWSNSSTAAARSAET